VQGVSKNWMYISSTKLKDKDKNKNRIAAATARRLERTVKTRRYDKDNGVSSYPQLQQPRTIPKPEREKGRKQTE
jgi:hypothetical protein